MSLSQAPVSRWEYDERYNPLTGDKYEGGFVNPLDSENGSITNPDDPAGDYMMSTAALGLPFFILMLLFLFFYLVFGVVRLFVSAPRTFSSFSTFPTLVISPISSPFPTSPRSPLSRRARSPSLSPTLPHFLHSLHSLTHPHSRSAAAAAAAAAPARGRRATAPSTA